MQSHTDTQLSILDEGEDASFSGSINELEWSNNNDVQSKINNSKSVELEGSDCWIETRAKTHQYLNQFWEKCIAGNANG